MAKKTKPASEPAKRFLSDIDEDEIVGGGIPDEDGWIYLQRSKAAKKPPAKPEKPKRPPPRKH